MACNEELVEVAQSAEMVLELPEPAQRAMERFNEKYPEEKFVYVEIDDYYPAEPNLKGRFKKTLFENDIDIKTLRFTMPVKERGKLGLILSTSESFHRLAELTKDVNEAGYEVFDIVEDQPTPIGGLAEFYKYIGANMKYPTEARNKGIEGRVLIQFVVDKEGNLTNIKSVKGIGAGCDEEAVRILENAPKWKPGKQRGNIVNVRMLLPIKFNLGGNAQTATNIGEKQLKLQQLTHTIQDAYIIITGRVLDSNKEPLSRASVVLKNSNISTKSDDSGIFKISVPNIAGQMIDVRHDGYDNITIFP